MHTSEVLRMLFDDNSFMQIGAREDENVIIGYGTINNRLVYAFGQNDQVHSGACGPAHIERILRAYRMAVKSKAPLIGIFHLCNLKKHHRPFSVPSSNQVVHSFVPPYPFRRFPFDNPRCV